MKRGPWLRPQASEGEAQHGRGKVAEFKPGDVAYIPQGFGHAIKNVGDEDLEIVQTWDNGKFEEIDLTKWVQSSPRYMAAGIRKPSH